MEQYRCPGTPKCKRDNLSLKVLELFYCKAHRLWDPGITLEHEKTSCKQLNAVGRRGDYTINNFLLIMRGMCYQQAASMYASSNHHAAEREVDILIRLRFCSHIELQFKCASSHHQFHFGLSYRHDFYTQYLTGAYWCRRQQSCCAANNVLIFVNSGCR